MQDATATGTATTDARPFRRQHALFWGVFAQFCYVGAQCAVAGFFINLVTEAQPGVSSARGSTLLSIAQGIFVVGRFLAAGSMRFVKPRLVLAVFLAGCVAIAAATMRASGAAAVVLLCLLLFCESCCFPTIFSLALRGLGRHTKRGAALLVAAVCGGAVFPPAMGAVADSANSTRFAMCVPMAGFVAALSFPLFLNLCERERARLDAYGKPAGARADEEKKQGRGEMEVVERA